MKAFSPEDTVFDVLDYVFELPPFPETSDLEQKKLIDKFAKEARVAGPFNGRYIKPDGYIALRNSLRKEKPGRSFFFYGDGGSGKTVMAIQIAWDMLWNNTVYAPIMIQIDPREIMNVWAVNIQDYLLQKLAEYFAVKSDQLDLSGHQYLIIIDNLDLDQPKIKDFLGKSNDFFERFSNCIFIFTSRNKIASQRLKNLDLTAKAMLTFFQRKNGGIFYKCL